MAIEKTPNVPPFVSYCAQLIPTVFDNSLSYYEALSALAKWMQDNLVDVINNNAAVTEQYIRMTEELKAYVENYFENLDVQEEINNKLDDMVEQGTLQEIITSYIQANVAWTFDTVDEMINSENLISGSYAQTLGYYALNDGGGALYKISNIEPSKYHITFGNGLFAELIGNDVNVDQLGADAGKNALSHYFNTIAEAQKFYPHVTDLTETRGHAAIQCAINYFHDGVISFNAKTYYIGQYITNGEFNRIHLVGDSKWKTVIKFNTVPSSEASMLILTSSGSRNVIENIDFVGPYEPTDTAQATLESYLVNGILMDHSSYNTIKNCVFRQCRSGVKTNYSWTDSFVDCYFARCNFGINLTGSAQNCIEINHCFAEYNNAGFFLGEGRSQTVINCDIENNNLYGIRKTNEGDAQIIGCYFEDKISIYFGLTYSRNVLISGCSFYQNSTNSAFYTPIEFAGSPDGHTQITVQNCNFVDGNNSADYSDHPAIMQLNNATTIPPVYINNTVTNMIEFRPTYMRGVHIKNGKLVTYYNRSFAQNFINATDGGSQTLDYTKELDYRVNLMASGTYSVKIPGVITNDRFVPHHFKLIVGPNNSGSNLGTVSLIPADSTIEVDGHTSITISDKNKVVNIDYVGNWSSKDHWVASVSA